MAVLSAEQSFVEPATNVHFPPSLGFPSHSNQRQLLGSGEILSNHQLGGALQTYSFIAMESDSFQRKDSFWHKRCLSGLVSRCSHVEVSIEALNSNRVGEKFFGSRRTKRRFDVHNSSS